MYSFDTVLYSKGGYSVKKFENRRFTVIDDSLKYKSGEYVETYSTLGAAKLAIDILTWPKPTKLMGQK